MSTSLESLENVLAQRGEALDRILALLTGDAPAKVAPRAARKKAPVGKAPVGKVTNPADAAAWDKALLSKARFAGKCPCGERSVYAEVKGNLGSAAVARDAGWSVEDALAALTCGGDDEELTTLVGRTLVG